MVGGSRNHPSILVLVFVQVVVRISQTLLHPIVSKDLFGTGELSISENGIEHSHEKIE